jgi:hypothetical protein
MIDFDTWWNSPAADDFRAQHDDMDGNVVRPIWEAAVSAAIPFSRPVQRPVAQLVRTKMAVGEDAFDIRVFEEALPNQCYLYAAPPQAIAAVTDEQIRLNNLLVDVGALLSLMVEDGEEIPGHTVRELLKRVRQYRASINFAAPAQGEKQ